MARQVSIKHALVENWGKTGKKIKRTRSCECISAKQTPFSQDIKRKEIRRALNITVDSYIRIEKEMRL